MSKKIEITQPDDWHVHFREGDMLEMVTNFSSRINKRCVAMPNTEIPITDTNKAFSYRESLKNASDNKKTMELIKSLGGAKSIHNYLPF